MGEARNQIVSLSSDRNRETLNCKYIGKVRKTKAIQNTNFVKSAEEGMEQAI
jgi:hypothetical protein